MLIYSVKRVEKVTGVSVKVFVAAVRQKLFVDVSRLNCCHHHLEALEFIFLLLDFWRLVLLQLLRREFSGTLGTTALAKGISGEDGILLGALSLVELLVLHDGFSPLEVGDNLELVYEVQHLDEGDRFHALLASEMRH